MKIDTKSKKKKGEEPAVDWGERMKDMKRYVLFTLFIFALCIFGTYIYF